MLERPVTPSSTDIVVAPTAVATSEPVPPAPRGPEVQALPTIIVASEAAPPTVRPPRPPPVVATWDPAEATVTATVAPKRGHGVAIAIGATTAVVLALGGLAAFHFLGGARASAIAQGSAAPTLAGSPPSASPSPTPPVTAPASPSASTSASASAPPVVPTPGPALREGEGALTIVCEPACERIAIDGRVRKATSDAIVLPAGKHGIGVSKNGYAGAWKLVPVASGERATVEFPLTPLPGRK
jgi:hypothetical protein